MRSSRRRRGRTRRRAARRRWCSTVPGGQMWMAGVAVGSDEWCEAWQGLRVRATHSRRGSDERRRGAGQDGHADQPGRRPRTVRAGARAGPLSSDRRRAPQRGPAPQVAEPGRTRRPARATARPGLLDPEEGRPSGPAEPRRGTWPATAMRLRCRNRGSPVRGGTDGHGYTGRCSPLQAPSTPTRRPGQAGTSCRARSQDSRQAQMTLARRLLPAAPAARGSRREPDRRRQGGGSPAAQRSSGRRWTTPLAAPSPPFTPHMASRPSRRDFSERPTPGISPTRRRCPFGNTDGWSRCDGGPTGLSQHTNDC
jgi:hypothetical protein